MRVPLAASCVFVLLLLSCVCVHGWKWYAQNGELLDLTNGGNFPCVYEYFDSSADNRVFYVGQAKHCASRIKDHDSEQQQWANLAWSVMLPRGTLLDFMPLEKFNDDFGHDVCILKQSFQRGLYNRNDPPSLSLRIYPVTNAEYRAATIATPTLLATKLNDLESTLINLRYRHGPGGTDNCNRNKGKGDPQLGWNGIGTFLAFKTTLNLQSTFNDGGVLECRPPAANAFMQINHATTNHATDKHDEHATKQTTHNNKPATAKRLQKVLDAHTP